MTKPQGPGFSEKRIEGAIAALQEKYEIPENPKELSNEKKTEILNKLADRNTDPKSDALTKIATYELGMNLLEKNPTRGM